MVKYDTRPVRDVVILQYYGRIRHPSSQGCSYLGIESHFVGVHGIPNQTDCQETFAVTSRMCRNNTMAPFEMTHCYDKVPHLGFIRC